MAYTIYTGTNGNNFIPFIGVTGFYSATLVNPYSGYTATFAEIKNINNGIYDGLGGTDTLSMTAQGDVLSLADADGTIMIRNIEIINAGLDGDIVNLAHATFTYGNVTIRGSDGDDLLWSNDGNDLVNGALGNDILDGGRGNDLLFGGSDSDYVSGGEGADLVFGGAGDDLLAYYVDGLWGAGFTLASLGSAIPQGALIDLTGKNRSFDTFSGDAEDTQIVVEEGYDRLIMTSGADVLVISDTISPRNGVFTPRVSTIDQYDGGDGDDVIDLSGAPHIATILNGDAGNDVLGGSTGDDTLNGGADNDLLFGAGGNDALNGGSGDDVYSYRLGDGSDTIAETSGSDRIIFGSGITLATTSFTVSGSDLLIGVGADMITIQNHFAADGSGRVESLEFADGTVFDLGSYTAPAAPVAADDAFSGDEDVPVTGNLLANDSDANGDTLTATAETLTTVQGGTVTINADGSFSYQGAANFNGTDSFSYTVNDGNGGSDTGTVNLTINAVNDAPVAEDDAFSGAEDAPIIGNVLLNDNDVDGYALSVEAQILTTAQGGSVTLSADGTFTYQGAGNFNGQDSFNYTVRDGAGAGNVGTVLLSVAAVNDAPVARDDHFNGLRGTNVTGNVIGDNGAGADSDIDGDTLSVMAQTITTAQGGTVTLAADGSFTYQGAADFFGSDSFDYTLRDGNGGSDQATVTLDIALDPAESIVGTDNGETIIGTNGNDEIFALGGNDTVKGLNGDDRNLGGAGNDVLYGDDSILTGQTIDKQFSDSIVLPNLKERTNIADLNPSAVPALGIADGNLSVAYDATASITFRKGYAGYDNSLGTYAVGSDGTITSVSLQFKNVKDAGIDVAHEIDLPTGANGGEYGFFIIANGNNSNAGYAGLNVSDPGNISFVYNYGKTDARAAKITDPGAKISIVYNDGIVKKVLKGDAYFTTERGESAAINKDGKVHVVSGLQDTNNVMLDIKKADLAAKPATYTKNGITLSALSGNLVGVADNKVGIKSTQTGGDAISGSETLRLSTSGAEKMVIVLSGIAAGDKAIDLKIYMNGDMSHALSQEFVTTSAVSGGKVTITLDAASLDGGLISAVDLYSVANSSHGTHNFYLENVKADMPGGIDTNSLRIGFEDLYNTGDADYEDVLFDLDIKPVTIADIQGGNDYLDGGAGNDTLYGEGGNDWLVIGLGADMATGGAGADTFKITTIDAFADTIRDFNASEGDVIDISAVLDGYDPLSDDIAAFVQLVQSGGNTELQINATGDAGGFVTAAIILGGTGDTLAHLVADGAIVA